MKIGTGRRAGAALIFLLLCAGLVWGAEDEKARVSPSERGGIEPPISSTGKYYAIIIGNNNYKKPILPLKTPVNDAEAVGKILREKYGFITEILKDASRSDILDALNNFKNPQFADQNFLIYYAGHGEYDNRRQKTYWLPLDARKGDPKNWISSDEITAEIKGLPFRHVLVISDSCYSGDILWEGKAKYYDESRRADYLKDMMKNHSRTLMASGSKDEPVADSGSGGHSVFATVLIKALNEMRETVFTAEELFGRGGVQEGVAGKSKQTPYYSFLQNSGHENGDFVFTKVIKEEVSSVRERTGRITVKSSVNRAKVFIDGEFVGETTYTIEHVKPGSHEIKVRKMSFHEYSTRIGVAEGQEVDVYAVLEQMSLPAFREIAEPVTGMKFVFVEGGMFKMGDIAGEGYDDERPLHQVQLDDFYMGKYEVTQGQWKRLMGNNPSEFKEGDKYPEGDKHPVENVSWDDTQEFIKRLNKKSEGIKFRLPTEAEWEYAARSGGKEEKFSGFSDEAELYEYGNFCDTNCDLDWKTTNQNDDSKHTAVVGRYLPNGLGLHDMTGNLWEWVEDTYYGNAYRKTDEISINPRWKEEGTGVKHVLRGGSWASPPQDLRTSCRNGYRDQSYRNNDVGFRLVMTPESGLSLPFYLWPAYQIATIDYSADYDVLAHFRCVYANLACDDQPYVVRNLRRTAR